jgi:hypothetical protein
MPVALAVPNAALAGLIVNGTPCAVVGAIPDAIKLPLEGCINFAASGSVDEKVSKESGI